LDGDVAIKIGLEVSSITNQITTSSGTIAYTIGTRNANTTLRLKDGETQILAGLIQDSDTRSATGIPGLSQIPIVGRLFGTRNADREKSEIVLSITPRIIRTQARPPSDTSEFWYGTETRSRTSPFTTHSYESDSEGGAAGGVGGGTAPVGPRVSVNQPVTPMPAAAAGTPGTAVTPAVATTAGAVATAAAAAAMSAPPPPPSGPLPHPTVTVDGPGETSVGQEFDVTVRMATDTGIARLRGQVRFDSTALQLVSATAGDLVPSSAGSPNVDAKSGGAQMDVVATDDPVQGEGSLMLLRFRALTARPASSIVAQVSAMGTSGNAMANAASQPLSLAIKP
jgi:general secretion pathway protein D